MSEETNPKEPATDASRRLHPLTHSGRGRDGRGCGVSIALLADMPAGDGPKRSNIRLRSGLARIARRVAMKALIAGREDILLEVYVAGIAHATALTTQPQEPTDV